MSKRTLNILVSAVMIIGLIAVASACQNDDGGLSFSVSDKADAYSRDYNNAYNIDDYQSGIYAVSYDIDASAMGKKMLVSNCADRVLLTVTDSEITLAYYCLNDSFTNIKLNGEDAISADRDGMKGYSFSVDRGDLDSALEMSGYVSAMKRDVQFKIVLHLDDALLIG